jgi:transcriptional regulator with XRE-family HTH domain
MLTPNQCRAARGFLGWTLADLAKASGISRASLNSFETGKGNIKADTLAAIRYSLESSGLDFDNQGVTPRQELVRVLKGQTAHKDLQLDILSCFKHGKGGEVLVMNADEKQAFAAGKRDLLDYLDNLAALQVTERLLTCEGDNFFVLPQECYRWIDRAAFQAGVMTCIYDDRVAIKVWQQDTIILIQNRDIATAEQERFNFLWQQAKIPPQPAK